MDDTAMGKTDNVGRRMSDTIARWATAAAATLATALLGIIIFFYGNVPKDIAELRESVGLMKFQMATIQDQQQEIVQSVRASQKTTDRVLILEQRTDRNAEQIKELDKRVDRIENRASGKR